MTKKRCPWAEDVEDIYGVNAYFTLAVSSLESGYGSSNFAKVNNHEVGKTFRYQHGEYTIYNMYTKPHVYFNAQNGMTMDEYLNNQRNCLNMLKRHMVFHNEKKLAIPKIACGLDKCNWEDIQKLLYEVFENTDFEIVVCFL